MSCLVRVTVLLSDLCTSEAQTSLLSSLCRTQQFRSLKPLTDAVVSSVGSPVQFQVPDLFPDMSHHRTFSRELSEASQLNRVEQNSFGESVHLAIDSLTTGNKRAHRETNKAIKLNGAFVLCTQRFSARRVWLLHSKTSVIHS